MRPLSPRAIELLEQLQSGSGLLSHLTWQRSASIAAVAQLGSSGEISAVPYLAPFILWSKHLADAAMEAIGKLLMHATGEELVQLDEQVRCRYFSWQRDEWHSIKPRQVRRLLPPTEARAAVFGVLSFHPSGYVREEAIRRLAAIRDGSEVPFLLIRLNDWVQPVRAASHAAVTDRLQRPEVSSFFKNLDLVFRLKQRGRHDHSSVIQTVARRLAEPEFAKHAMDALCSRSRFVRRHAYRTLVSTHSENRPRFIMLSLQSDDGVLRLWATRDAKSLLSDKQLQGELPKLLNDSFMPVRREALNCIMHRFPDEVKDALIAAIFDSSPAVRDFARFHLRKLDGFDPAEAYRQGLRSTDTQLVAILGIGEAGRAEDAGLVLPYLSSNRSKIRAAAIRSLAKLDEAHSADLLWEALKDDHKKVAVEALNALKRCPEKVDVEKLAHLLRNDERRHVRFAATTLIAAQSFWTAVPLLIEASALQDEEIAVAAQQHLLRRLNRVFTSPNAEQRMAIVDAIDRHRRNLPPGFVREIQQWYDSRTSGP
ncbi:MAG TPA: HEAT repeat domain-containing protein [Lacipirellulaceae bacterium]|nr:HEAT repeat domain-containing protein [Lacipirellulaceae bacterium]